MQQGLRPLLGGGGCYRRHVPAFSPACGAKPGRRPVKGPHTRQERLEDSQSTVESSSGRSDLAKWLLGEEDPTQPVERSTASLQVSQQQSVAAGTLSDGSTETSELSLGSSPTSSPVSGRGDARTAATGEAAALVAGLQIQTLMKEEGQSDPIRERPPIPKQRLWFMAIKPPMYSVALVPILVAAAASYAEFGAFSGRLFAQLVLGAFSIIAWLNTSNDVFDASMGVDGAKVESIVNITGNRLGCLWVANAFLAGGLTLLGRAIWQAGDLRAAGALAAAIALGYMYQGPPFRLSYKGLGEPLCFITFGPLSTCAFFLVQASMLAAQEIVPIDPPILVASVLVGITTAAILFCSHFHQIEGDRAALKMSPLVRLGNTTRGFHVLRGIVVGVYGLAFAGSVLGVLPIACLPLLLLSLPQAMRLLSFCSQNFLNPEKVRPLKIYATKWHMAVGAWLAAGIATPRFVSQVVAAF